MKFSTILCLAVGLISVTSAAPNLVDFNSLLVQPQRQLDLAGDSRKLIEELANGLRKSAQDAAGAVGNFTTGIRDEATKIREKIASDIEILRQRVREAMDNVWERFGNSTAGVRECVDSRRNEASTLFNETVAKSLTCVDERVADIGKQVEELSAHAQGGMDYANQALEEMRKCTEENKNLFTVGSCLAGVAFRVESKSLVFGAQMATMIARINLSIATLPAALEICAGTQVVQAGIATGRIVLEIGSCSASSIFNGIVGGNTGTTTATSTTIASIDTTTVIPQADTTVIPPADTTTVIPPADTTTVIPPADTTTVIPPADTTTVIPPADTTTVIPPADTTTVIPPVDTTTVIALADTTTVIPSAI